MGAVWLGSLPKVLAEAGLNVTTWPGWETRSRSSGGYDAVWGIGIHHDAAPAGTSLTTRCRYAWEQSPTRPIGAVWLHTDGSVVVGAAGATNTQGKGGPYQTSKGVIPLNAGNRYILSIEASNNGVGEVWPEVQQQAYVKMCAALCEWLKLDPKRDVFAHFEWTSRKIDPAGPSRYAAGANKWNMDAFRNDVAGASFDVSKFIYAGIDSNGVDYNKNTITVPCGGSGLVLQSDLSVRTAALRNGVVTLGASDAYMRVIAKDPVQVPFEVSAEITPHSRLHDVFIFGENRLPTWEWGLCFHPVFVDEDNNIVSCVKPSNKTWSASGQINKAYGIPRQSVFVKPVDHDAQMGVKHHALMRVPRVGWHEIYWDGQLVYRVVEKDPPASWWWRPLRWGFRFDFYDVSISNVRVSSGIQPSTEELLEMLVLDYKKDTPDWTAFMSNGIYLAHIFNGDAFAPFERAGVSRQSVSEQELLRVIQSSLTTTDAPAALPTLLKTEWDKRKVSDVPEA